MPVMGGAEATRLIRSGTTNARNPEIPIIAITANAFQTNAETCKLAGMNDYITKPVSAAALREAVQKGDLGELVLDAGEQSVLRSEQAHHLDAVDEEALLSWTCGACSLATRQCAPP